jgi:hypothetical protein
MKCALMTVEIKNASRERMHRKSAIACTVSFLLAVSSAQAQLPDIIAAKGETEILKVHAEGAQIYDCKPDSAGKLAWQFREPIATLIFDGNTIGKHYAGPSWELEDGSTVTGKVAGRAPGAGKDDIPWLKLDVASERGQGRLSGITTIQRINTKGGAAEGACTAQGSLLSVPYSSEYIFLKRK